MFPGISSWLTVPVQLIFSAIGLFMLVKAVAGLESAHQQGPAKAKRQKWAVAYAGLLIVTVWVFAPIIYNTAIYLSAEAPGASKSLIDFFKNPPVVTDIQPTLPITYTRP